MAEPTGKDLTRESIEILPGLLIDTKIRVGGILYLEKVYDKNIFEIQEKVIPSGKITDVVNLIIALALQRNPEKTEKEIRDSIDILDTLDEITGSLKKLKDAFKVESKN